MEGTIRFCRTGAAHVIAAALELLAEVEDSGEFCTDAVLAEARSMRVVVSEWIDESTGDEEFAGLPDVDPDLDVDLEVGPGFHFDFEGPS